MQTKTTAEPVMSLTSRTDSQLPDPDPSRTFHISDCRLSIAVDTSGSTYNGVLRAEKHAIDQICNQLPSRTRAAARVLPWNDSAQPNCQPTNTALLTSSGGTDPRVLLRDQSHLRYLRESSLWFLFTDGIIEQDIIQDFAKGLAVTGLHGTACASIIFGDGSERPVNCNITVALAVFAVTPDCLLLYHNIQDGSVHLLQCKGCFNSLISPGKEPPILRATTQWSDLPVISIEDLCKVSVPPPRKLKAHEIALQGGRTISIDDLWNQKIQDAQLLDEIFDVDDNLRSIMLTAQTRGNVPQLHEWLNKQEAAIPDLLKVARPGLGAEASGLVEQLATLIGAGQSGEVVDGLQKRLRDVHKANLQSLQDQTRVKTAKVSYRRESYDSCRRISVNFPTNGGSLNRVSGPPLDPRPVDRAETQTVDIVYIPGFQHHSNDDNFKGTCHLCGAFNSILTVLLRKPTTTRRTEGFPAIQSRTKLAFPLAMGNFPETDIVSTFICCDACAYFLADRGRSPAGEDITATLPLVCFSRNRSAWLEMLGAGVEQRFDVSDLPTVYLAILCTTIQKSAGKTADARSDGLWLRALQWVCGQLMQEARAPSVLSSSFAKTATDLELQPLNSLLSKGFRNIREARRGSWLLQYPIEGFLVMNLAMSDPDVVEKPKDEITDKHVAIFQRLLYHLAEQYHNYKTANGTVVTQLAMAQTVIEQPQKRSAHLGQHPDKERTFSSGSLLIVGSLYGRDPPGARKPLPKSSISVISLLGGPLINGEAIKVFRKLGSKFAWIEDNAHFAIAVFLHYLVRMETNQKSAADHFEQIKSLPALALVFSSPHVVGREDAEDLIEQLLHIA